MFNEEIIERLERLRNEVYNEDRDGYEDDVALELAIKAVKLMMLEDIDIDSTYWLYYDDNGNRRGEK